FPAGVRRAREAPDLNMEEFVLAGPHAVRSLVSVLGARNRHDRPTPVHESSDDRCLDRALPEGFLRLVSRRRLIGWRGLKYGRARGIGHGRCGLDPLVPATVDAAKVIGVIGMVNRSIRAHDRRDVRPDCHGRGCHAARLHLGDNVTHAVCLLTGALLQTLKGVEDLLPQAHTQSLFDVSVPRAEASDPDPSQCSPVRTTLAYRRLRTNSAVTPMPWGWGRTQCRTAAYLHYAQGQAEKTGQFPTVSLRGSRHDNQASLYPLGGLPCLPPTKASDKGSSQANFLR